MLTPLILLSVFSIAGWLYVAAAWRHDADPPGVRRDGILVSNRRGSLPATMSLTLFVVAGWLLYASGSGREGSTGIWRYVIASLVFIGLVFVLCFISIFLFDRPRSMIPPSIRPNRP